MQVEARSDEGFHPRTRAARCAGTIALACAAAAAAVWGLACGTDDFTGSGALAETDSSGGNQPPAIESLRFEPAVPLPGELVDVAVEASDPDGDPIEFTYLWKVDGSRVEGEPGSSALRLHSTGHPALLEVTVIASDGRRESEAAQLQVEVGNRPPQVIQLQLFPYPNATVEDSVWARVRAWDPDRDELTYDFAWRVNDAPVQQLGPTLASRHYQRGDMIRVVATASDASATSAETSSELLRIVNSSPRITSQAPAFDRDGVFLYRPLVEDPDGDRFFRYRLLESPKGMSINLVDGTIRWRPEPSQAGLHSVRFEIDDRNGGTVEQSLSVHFAVENAPGPAAKKLTLDLD